MPVFTQWLQLSPLAWMIGKIRTDFRPELKTPVTEKTMTAKVHPLPPMPLLADPPQWNETPLPPWEAIGQSVMGNTINLYRPGKSNVLVMGGVHGDESEGIFLAHLLMALPGELPVIPCLNPDGALLRQRWNRNNVDLNRNLPTDDWQPEPLNPRYPPGAAPASEPETQAFLKALESTGATIVLNLHSYKESFVEIERAPETLAPEVNQAIEGFLGVAKIERRVSIGYQTPGALGAFGIKNNLLILTYELYRGMSHGEIEPLAQPLNQMLHTLAAEPFRG